ncbi:MAG: YdcF family protein [Pseudomonadota bacterium]
MKSKQLKYLTVVILVLISIIDISITYFRNTIIDFFVIESYAFKRADIIVVLEGGGIKFPPTLERVKKAIDIYSSENRPILVCSEGDHRDDIIKFIKSNGVKSKDIIISSFEYGVGNGTYNNVKEIITILNEYPKYRNIEIITSPYHELRVYTIFKKLLEVKKLSETVNFNFSHIKNSEIMDTNNGRFINIIIHELLGVMFFRLQTIRGVF